VNELKKYYSEFAPLILRIVIGISFLLHGYSKVTNLAGTTKFFTMLNIPMPQYAATFVGWLEIVGGIALILGLLSQLFAILLAINMIVAILSAKWGKGWVGIELELLLLAGSLSLLFSGPGLISLTNGWISSKRTLDKKMN
jgi:putative oxidoreductase